MKAWRLMWRANGRVARGDFTSAKPLLIDLLNIEPNNSFALLMLARCYEHEGQIVEALQFAERAIRVDPPSLIALQITISLAIAVGEHERAAGYVRQALTLPEMTTEMPQNLNVFRYLSRFIGLLSRIPLLRRRFRPEKAANAIRDLDPSHRAVELHKWKQWALEYLAWQSGNPGERNESVLH